MQTLKFRLLMVHSQVQISSLEYHQIKLLKAEHTTENRQLLTEVDKNFINIHDLMLLISKTCEISMFYEPP